MKWSVLVSVVAMLLSLAGLIVALWVPPSPRIKALLFTSICLLGIFQIFLVYRGSKMEQDFHDQLLGGVQDIQNWIIRVGTPKPANLIASQQTSLLGDATTTSTTTHGLSRIGNLHILPGTPFLVQCRFSNPYSSTSLGLMLNTTLTRPIHTVAAEESAITWYVGPETIQANVKTRNGLGPVQLIDSRPTGTLTDATIYGRTEAGTLTIFELVVYTLPR
jgi:hypothetical protein